jgi:transposase
MTFMAALRYDRITAPRFIEGPINGETFLLYIEKVLAPPLRHGDIVIMDNLGSHKAHAVRRAIRAAGARLFLFAEIRARSQPDRAVLRLLNTGCAKPHSEPPRLSTMR